MMKKQLSMEYNARQTQRRMEELNQVMQLKQVRPELITCSDEELETMKENVIRDMELMSQGMGML